MGLFLGDLDDPLADSAVMDSKEVGDGSQTEAFEAKLKDLLLLKVAVTIRPEVALYSTAPTVANHHRVLRAVQRVFPKI